MKGKITPTAQIGRITLKDATKVVAEILFYMGKIESKRAYVTATVKTYLGGTIPCRFL